MKFQRGISEAGIRRIAQQFTQGQGVPLENAGEFAAEGPNAVPEIDQSIVDGALTADLLTPLDDMINTYLEQMGIMPGTEQWNSGGGTFDVDQAGQLYTAYKSAIYSALIAHLQQWY